MDHNLCDLFVNDSDRKSISIIERSLRFNNIFMKFLAQMCRLESFLDDNSTDCDERAESSFGDFEQWSEGLRQQQQPVYQQKSDKRPTWSVALLIVSIVSMIHMVINIYCQFAYDILSFKLSQLQELHRDAPSDEKRIQQLALMVRRSEETLKSLGAPHMRFHFITECVYMFILMVQLGAYIQTMMYYKYVHPYDSYLCRSILDPNRASRLCDGLIWREINKFIKSSENHANALIEAKHNEDDHSLEGRDEDYRSKNGLRIIFNHRLTCKQLNQMNSRNVLRPFNRLQKWMNHLFFIYSLFSLAAVLYAITYITTTTSFLYLLAEPLDGWAELIIFLELALFLGVSSTCIYFHGSIMVVTSIDQIILARKMRKLIERCISLNSARYERCLILMLDGREDCQINKSQRNWLIDCYRTQMNGDLLLVLMHFKIFVGQLRPVRYNIEPITFIACILLFFIPISGRLSMPYVKQSFNWNFRLMVLIASVICTSLTNVGLIPICHLNTRCLDLYRSLSSLMAHVVELGESNWGSSIYDGHSVLVLRRELDHPEDLLRQFVSRATGIDLTYSNIVRLHFWVGLIILSILVTQSNPNGVFSTLFRDPFGIM